MVSQLLQSEYVGIHSGLFKNYLYLCPHLHLFHIQCLCRTHAPDRPSRTKRHNFSSSTNVDEYVSGPPTRHVEVNRETVSNVMATCVLAMPMPHNDVHVHPFSVCIRNEQYTRTYRSPLMIRCMARWPDIDTAMLKPKICA